MPKIGTLPAQRLNFDQVIVKISNINKYDLSRQKMIVFNDPNEAHNDPYFPEVKVHFLYINVF